MLKTNETINQEFMFRTTEDNINYGDNNSYLVTACMRHLRDKYNDKCYELETLRLFKTVALSQQDIEHYYEISPRIVEAIDKETISDVFFEYIYEYIVLACVYAIDKGDYHFAKERFFTTMNDLEEVFITRANKSGNTGFKTRIRSQKN